MSEKQRDIKAAVHSSPPQLLPRTLHMCLTWSVCGAGSIWHTVNKPTSGYYSCSQSHFNLLVWLDVICWCSQKVMIIVAVLSRDSTKCIFIIHYMYFDCVWGKEHQETAFESFRRKHGSCFENDPKCILRFNESKNFVPVSIYFQVKIGFKISDSQWDIWKPDAAFCSSFPWN